ncbi:MAG: hypothetical protein ACRYFE_05850 [Janthinobacterium lividum]
MNKSWYTSIVTNLTSLIGQYRDTKQSPSDSNQEALINNYNQVVNDMNRIQMPG